MCQIETEQSLQEQEKGTRALRTGSNIRVLVADDHAVVRSDLRTLLEQEQDIEVVGEAGDGRDAVREAQRLHPDVVLMDIAMPEMDGIEATRRICSREPSTKILALSVLTGSSHIHDMMTAGASGYVVKDSSADELVPAVRTVMEGRIFFSNGISSAVKEPPPASPVTDGGDDESLTALERQVLEQLLSDQTTKAIADTLSLTIRAVINHRKQIMIKLGVRDFNALLEKFNHSR